MSIGPMILLTVAAALMPGPAPADECRVRVLLSSGAVMSAVSVVSEDGWIYIYLDDEAVVGLPEPQVLGVEHSSCGPDRLPSHRRRPWTLVMAPAKRFASLHVLEEVLEAFRDTVGIPTSGSERLGSNDGAAWTKTDSGSLDDVRRHSPEWHPRSAFALDDVFLDRAARDNLMDRLRSRDPSWWEPQSRFAQEDIYLDGITEQSRPDRRDRTPWWHPESRLAQEDIVLQADER